MRGSLLSITAPIITEQGELNVGILEQFFNELPEKAFRLGIRVLLVFIGLVI
jgi:hypothetical protein